jgi:hypothetical protein
MRTLLTPSLLLISLCGLAQQQVRITDPKAIVADQQLHRSKAAEECLRTSGLSVEQQEIVLAFSEPGLWPMGLRSDSARAANGPYVRNYAAYRVCTYTEDSVKRSVLMVPARSNIHMPEDLRPQADFYFAVPDVALEEVVAAQPRPAISRGPRWKNLREARIIKPDELYATYDLGSDSAGLEALRSRGLSQAEIDAVVFRSHERNWPEGMDSFDERYPRMADLKRYKAYFAARWNDKVLLIIPVEKNRKMPALMRPYVDIYFIYAASAVEVEERK